MDGLFLLGIWVAAILVAYLMAEKRGRDPRWAIVGGLLFGWFACLYYLVAGKARVKE